MQSAILKKEPIRLTDELSLHRGRVHEIIGAANDSFAVLMASKIQGPVVWVGGGRDVGTLAPMALKNFIDPARIVLTEGANRKDVLWASEQALRSRGAALTIVQLTMGPDLYESRRLQLAAEQGGGVGLILIERRAQSSASQTRWTCEPRISAHSAAKAETGFGPWFWEVTKNKSGPVGRWLVTWTGGVNETNNVHMAACTAA